MNKTKTYLALAIASLSMASAHAEMMRITAANFAGNYAFGSQACGNGRQWGLLVTVTLKDYSSKTVMECHTGPTNFTAQQRYHAAQLNLIAADAVSFENVGGSAVCYKTVGMMADAGLSYLKSVVPCPKNP